jgi:hypothetical protein
MSYMPAADHPDYPAMLSALRRLFDEHAVDGLIAMSYETEIYAGRLDAGSGASMGAPGVGSGR